MVIVDRIYLNEGEIVIAEDFFDSLDKENKNLKEGIKKLDYLLKSDLLNEANCGNDYPTPETWNKYIKRQRNRLREIFGKENLNKNWKLPIR